MFLKVTQLDLLCSKLQNIDQGSYFTLQLLFFYRLDGVTTQCDLDVIERKSEIAQHNEK